MNDLASNGNSSKKPNDAQADSAGSPRAQEISANGLISAAEVHEFRFIHRFPSQLSFDELANNLFDWTELTVLRSPLRQPRPLLDETGASEAEQSKSSS